MSQPRSETNLQPVAPQPYSRSQATAPFTPEELPPQCAAPQLRIDVAHGDSSGPHSAAENWLEQRDSWLDNVLQRRSLLAVALIAVAVVGIAIMMHNRAQHHAIRPSNDPAANASQSENASRTDSKDNARYPQAAAGAPAMPDNQHWMAGRPALEDNSHGMLGSVLSAEPPSRSTVPGPAQSLPAPQYSTEDPRFSYPAAAPRQGQAPAGANMPASIEPTSSALPPSAASIGPESFYSAQRDVPPPSGGANIGASGGAPGAAAFEGGIKNPFEQFSR
jgi:hypothetical protein